MQDLVSNLLKKMLTYIQAFLNGLTEVVPYCKSGYKWSHKAKNGPSNRFLAVKYDVFFVK